MPITLLLAPGFENLSITSSVGNTRVSISSTCSLSVGISIEVLFEFSLNVSQSPIYKALMLVFVKHEAVVKRK